MSSSVAGTTSLPSSMTTQCTGRTNSASPAPQRMRRGIGSCIERRLHQRRQQPHGCLAGACSGEEQKRALGVVDALERLDGGAAALGEGERGARRRAARIEGGAQRRSAALQTAARAARAARRRTSTARRRGVAKPETLTVRQPRLVEPCGRGLRRTPARACAAPSAAAPRCRSRPGNRARRCSRGRLPASPARSRRPARCGFSSGKPSASRLAR